MSEDGVLLYLNAYPHIDAVLDRIKRFGGKEKIMKACIVLAHPYEKSFNHAILQTSLDTFAELKIQTFVHDLYKDRFNPVLTKDELGKKETKDILVKQYLSEILLSELLVFIHPNWWGQPPAIMKGYIDRVFRPPYAYDFPQSDSGGGLPIEKLDGKIGVVFNTSNTEEKRETDVFHDPLEDEWIRCIFGFCGIKNTIRKTFRVIADSDAITRKKWLEEVKEILINKCTN